MAFAHARRKVFSNSVSVAHDMSGLAQLGYTNVDIRIGDGSRGWGEHAPYDKILVAAAAEGGRERCSNSSSPPDASSCPWAQEMRNNWQP
jgi:protein-L-isoaspartate(D-aspartate) O-methyltransferase